MELGVQGLNSITRFDATSRLARLAEDLGYGSWWAHDHVVLPTGEGAQLDARTPIVDPLVHLAHVAAVTSRIALGTAVIILPQRNPLVLAKQAASLDALSGGRFVLGVGAGWLAAEMTAVGATFTDRGSRTDEYLDAMASLWDAPAPEFHGRHVDFAGVDAHPRPTGLRVVVGGRSAGAYRRAVSRGHGFYGNGTPDDIAGDLAGLRRAAGEVERPGRLGELEITAMPLEPVDAGAVDRYRQLGVHRLVLRPQAFDDPDGLARYLERNATLADATPAGRVR
ncbi:TIGR03619 family F420-dependent LLM class oxidoreductase [Pseudonocardia humida]|uniref:TIGR03619 family F420-dependent LLM class oxidoreductase n=1 Tax=Pseudonocardia humida TaxID=2800819 RepID=A0ABT0ZV20_9PSEU|nr:TIGR03619 family F420-dependent LLM class oxidoreductase [Pseudonocardia humida]MCO1654576.1 TIGR03619 family F420-dependent LLM class oxidoreductase [Pseudonocardia humida]